MKEYIFEQTVFYSDNYNRKVSLPDNIVFCEWMRYSEKQRFIFSVVKDPTQELIEIFNNNFAKTLKLGNLLIGIFTNVKPLTDIPEISIDEMNELYAKDLRKLYIVTEYENCQYRHILNDLLMTSLVKMPNTDEDSEITIDFEEAKRLEKVLKTQEKYYIESIVRPIKFVKNGAGEHGPTLLCDCVQFKSWLDKDREVNTFSKVDLDSTKFENYIGSHYKVSVYMNKEAEPWKEMYENRITEITKSAFE